MTNYEEVMALRASAERVYAWMGQFSMLLGLDPNVVHKANHAELLLSDLERLVRASRLIPTPLPSKCRGCGSTHLVERSREWWCVEQDAMSPCPHRLPGIPCETCERPRAVHVCLSCSSDGIDPGRGCGDCRNSGWNQTPCLPPRRAS
jgi:hypothetical protein